MNEFWVFGATKSVGKGLAEILSEGNIIVSFSRRIIETSPTIQQVLVDFNDFEKVNDTINKQLIKSIPDGVIFCQRYRPNSEGTLKNIINGCIVELGPVISFIENIKKVMPEKEVSVVLLTSIAGELIHVDIPLYYHILKSNTLCMNKYISVHERHSKIRINCICLGEFLKYHISEYNEPEIAKYNVLRNFTNNSKIISIQEITDLVIFLVSSASYSLTGQVFLLEGNVNKIAQESLLRQVLKLKE